MNEVSSVDCGPVGKASLISRPRGTRNHVDESGGGMLFRFDQVLNPCARAVAAVTGPIPPPGYSKQRGYVLRADQRRKVRYVEGLVNVMASISPSC